MKTTKAGIIFCAFLTLLNDRLSETVLLPFLPKLKTFYGVNASTLGLLAGTYALAQFAVAPLIGALSDKHGRKPVITICVLGSFIGLSLFALSIHLLGINISTQQGVTPLIIGLLFFSRIIDGGSGGTAASAAAVLADISTPENRAKTFGIIGAAFGLGFIIGPLIGGILTSINFTLPGIAAILFALINLIVVIYLLPETYTPDSTNSKIKKRELNPISQLIKVFNNKLISRLSFAFFVFFIAFNGLTAFLLLYLEEVFKWSGNEVILSFHFISITKNILPSLTLVWVGVIAIVIQGALIGKLVKRFGEWRLTMSGIGFVISGCILLVSANKENSIPMVFTAGTFLALGTGLVVPSLRAIISKKLSSSGQGAILGNLQGLQSLGSFLGAWGAGRAYAEIGPSSPFWIGMLILIVVGILISGGNPNNQKNRINKTI